MAYTQADLDAVRAARVALATGSRVVRVSIGEVTTEYQAGDDAKLRMLEADIREALAGSAGALGQRYILVATEKGL